MRVLRWVLYAFAALAIGLALLMLVARRLDGPLGPIPGGPLGGAPSLEDPGDWSFAGDVPTLELEVGGRSRTVWYVTRGPVLYVAAGGSDRAPTSRTACQPRGSMRNSQTRAAASGSRSTWYLARNASSTGPATEGSVIRTACRS